MGAVTPQARVTLEDSLGQETPKENTHGKTEKIRVMEAHAPHTVVSLSLGWDWLMSQGEWLECPADCPLWQPSIWL